MINERNNNMINDMVLDRLNSIQKRLENGESVDLGEFRVILDLSYEMFRGLLVEKQQHQLSVNKEDIEMADLIVSYVCCLLNHHKQVFPTIKEEQYNPQHLEYKPSWAALQLCPIKQEFNTGTSIPETTRIISTNKTN